MNNILKNIESFFFEIGWDGGHLIILNFLIMIIGSLFLMIGIGFLCHFLFTKDGRAEIGRLHKNDKLYFIKFYGLLLLFIIIGLIVLFNWVNFTIFK